MDILHCLPASGNYSTSINHAPTATAPTPIIVGIQSVLVQVLSVFLSPTYELTFTELYNGNCNSITLFTRYHTSQSISGIFVAMIHNHNHIHFTGLDTYR